MEDDEIWDEILAEDAGSYYALALADMWAMKEYAEIEQLLAEHPLPKEEE